MDRGIQATVVGLEEAKKALKLKGWTQDYLAGGAGCTRQTVSRFLSGKRIEKQIFQDICSELDLKWVEIAELEAEEKADQPPNIDELVETVRINIYDSIQTKCGSMRVLDMTQPIDLNAIYTNVNILEKITGRQRLEYQELMQNCSSENYERFSLSGVQESRIPALDAVPN
jgi:transcriptional regulator with XRE-family HTH domain